MQEENTLAEDRDFAEALARIGESIDGVYRTKHIHSALCYLTRVEFEKAWQREHQYGSSPPKAWLHPSGL
jgi:hypothetical protein